MSEAENTGRVSCWRIFPNWDATESTAASFSTWGRLSLKRDYSLGRPAESCGIASVCSALSWSLDLYWFRSCRLEEINPELKWGTPIVSRGSYFLFPPNWCKTRALSQVNLQLEKGKPAYLCFVKPQRGILPTWCLQMSEWVHQYLCKKPNTKATQSTLGAADKILAAGVYVEVLVWKFGAAAVCALLVLSPLRSPAAVAPVPPGSPVEQGPFPRVPAPPAMIWVLFLLVLCFFRSSRCNRRRRL